MTGRVSGQDVNVNPELNELLKCLCTILMFECIWCLDGAKVILELVTVIKAPYRRNTNSIMAILTNHVRRTRLITSLTDKPCSLDRD